MTISWALYCLTVAVAKTSRALISRALGDRNNSRSTSGGKLRLHKVITSAAVVGSSETYRVTVDPVELGTKITGVLAGITGKCGLMVQKPGAKAGGASRTSKGQSTL